MTDMELRIALVLLGVFLWPVVKGVFELIRRGLMIKTLSKRDKMLYFNMEHYKPTPYGFRGAYEALKNRDWPKSVVGIGNIPPNVKIP